MPKKNVPNGAVADETLVEKFTGLDPHQGYTSILASLNKSGYRIISVDRKETQATVTYRKTDT